MEVLKFNISFDRVAEIYDRTRSLPNKVMKTLVETLCVELKNCARILDVGVGTGRLAEPLQNAGFEILGIDISKKMMRKAREKGCAKPSYCRCPFHSIQRQKVRCYD